MNLNNEERIGEAWRLHRNQNNTEAIKIFNEILNLTPNSVDALYGLGLAKRADGDTAGARDAFEKALDSSQKALDGVSSSSAAEGQHGRNDLATYEDDRYMMLNRMIRQRLSEVDGDY